MTIGFLFWLLMILWFVFGVYWTGPDFQAGRYGIVGSNLLLFVLLFLLGWKVFGFVIQG